jgi:hypothetical protein
MRYSKYRAIPTFRDGIRFASKKEADRYVQLRMLEKAGEIAHLKCQEPFELWVGDKKIGRYIADFTYIEDGIPICEDVKGMKTPLYRWKRKHMEAQYHMKIRET